MRILVVAFILFAAGCVTKDKKAEPEIPVVPDKIDGERSFKSNCASCHKPDKDFAAPALKGSLARWGDKKAMYDFIRNPPKSISENTYAEALAKKWGPAMMTSFNLSDAEIDAIMNYCENYVAPSGPQVGQ